MKLTNDDKRQLVDWGYTEEDIDQIERASQRNKTVYEMGGEPISREEAIMRLGRREYLSGLSRSAFHFTASRTTDNGKVILFDSSRLFK